MPVGTIKRMRGKLARGVLTFTDICAIMLGMLPFRYDANATFAVQHHHHRIGVLYTFGIYGILLLGVVYIILMVSNSTTHIELFDQKPLSGTISAVHAAFSILAVLIVLFRNWRERGVYLQLVADMNALRLHYFHQRTPELSACGTFDNFIVLGAMVRVIQNVSTCWALFEIRQPWMITILVCVIMPLINVTYTMQHQFCFGVLHIFRFSWTLNRQLQALAKNLQFSRNRKGSDGGKCAAHEIAGIGIVCMRLTDLCERLMRAFDWQVLLIMYLFITSNAEHMFNFSITWSGKIQAMDFLVFIQIVLINCLDLWFIFTVCELVLVESRQTQILLRKFNEMTYLDARLLRNLEEMAFMHPCHRERFSVCGFFELNYSTGCDVIVTSVMCLVVLVQYDFKND